MKSVRDQFLRSFVMFAVVVGAVASMAMTAQAFSPRVPQVAVGGGSLQGYLNGVGEAINVNTDQLDAQTWSTTVSGNSTFTLMLEYAGNAGSNALGVYNGNAASPALYQVFPGVAIPGWYATAHFGTSGSLVVSLFDDNSAYQGQSSYSGVNKNNFGFYLQGPGGTFYSQDYRNPGGDAMVLTYAGTGVNAGSWWQCFEDTHPGDRDFEDAVMFVESVNPVPAANTSWGRLKGLYR